MKTYRYKDLGIVSAQKPKNSHLFIETSDGTLWLADSVDAAKLYYSLDKGDNWILKTTRVDKIKAFYYDRINEKLYAVDGTTADASSSRQFYLDISDTGTPYAITEGDLAGGVDEMLDIIWDGTRAFSMKFNRTGADPFIVDFYARDFSGAVFSDSQTTGDQWNAKDYDMSPGVVVSGFDWFLYWHEDNNNVELWKYQIAANGWTKMETSAAGIRLSANKSQQGIAYDGSNILNFVLYDTGDSKHYLYTYNISGDVLTKHSEYNIALMLDRNNSGVAPNEFEKAFSISASETVYEIKARRGGIRILQDISAITDVVIIAITDNFLMNSDGDIFEFTDVTNEISTILYNDGIIGIPKRGTFTIHPDFHINWSKGDSIKIYDQYDQLEFHGLITYKNRNSRGIYVYKIDSFTNEIYQKTYENDYSGDDSDTKQKDIIDNACDFCYRASSIVGTTTNYDYEYNRAIIYLFWLTRFLERQVPYIEPDGKIWTKAHDGLVKNDMIYPGTYNFRDDADGAEPSGWTSNNDANCTTTVITSLGGHKKVLQLYDNSAIGSCEINVTFTGQTSGTIEIWWRLSSNAKRSSIFIYSGGSLAIRIYAFENGFWRHYSGGATDVLASVVDQWIHHKIVFDCATDTWDWYIDGTKYGDGLGFDNVQTTLDKIILITSDGPTGYYNYFDALGFSWDPAYTVGDNEVAWEISNHWQEVFLIDIPGLEEKIQGFFDGNSGITRNIIRYKNNATTIRPVAAIRDPIEQLQGILPLNEFRDPKIEEATEANQLGDNRYDIWSSDIIFLGLRVEGQGYLQPGKTVEIENTGEITIIKNDYLLLSFERDPKNDVYNKMILSDNIIFPSEFTKLQDTSNIQIHTASVQAIENQFDINLHLTREGGLAVRLTNKTGGASVKGTLVEVSAGTDNAFTTTVVDTVECFGVVYEDGIADGSECLVVIGGRCQVLLKDATASTRGNWVETSDVVGRADATSATPAAAPTHFKEIGHCIESKGADTDVLAFIMMHFL